MNKILSICIPCYNVESYIDETMSSLISSKYIELLDIIAVDDGSTDDTNRKLKKYQRLYPKSIKVIEKENGGYGSVFNRGMEEVQGKFFCLLDGDDWYDTNEFDRLIEKMETTDVDIFICGCQRINITTNKNEKQFFNVPIGEILTANDLVQNIGINKYLGISSIFTKSEIWKKNNLRLSEVAHYVDMEYAVYYIPFIETGMYLDYTVYQYRVGNPNSGSQLKAMMNLSQAHISVTKSLFNFYKSIECEDNLKDYVKDKVFRMIKKDLEILLCKYLKSKNSNELKEYCIYLNNNDIFNDPSLKKWRILKKCNHFTINIYAWILHFSTKNTAN